MKYFWILQILFAFNNTYLWLTHALGTKFTNRILYNCFKCSINLTYTLCGTSISIVQSFTDNLIPQFWICMSMLPVAGAKGSLSIIKHTQFIKTFIYTACLWKMALFKLSSSWLIFSWHEKHLPCNAAESLGQPMSAMRENIPLFAHTSSCS